MLWTVGTRWPLMRALNGWITSLMNASRFGYVFDAAERPTIVHGAVSAGRLNGLPVPARHASKDCRTSSLLCASFGIVSPHYLEQSTSTDRRPRTLRS